jgi:hypothetical protein
MPQETTSGRMPPGIDETTSDHISIPAPDLKARQDAVADTRGSDEPASGRESLRSQPAIGLQEPVTAKQPAQMTEPAGEHRDWRRTMGPRGQSVRPMSLDSGDRPLRESPAVIEAREWTVHNPAASVAIAAGAGLLAGIAFRKSFSHKRKRRY